MSLPLAAALKSFLPEIVAAPLLPVLLAQGRHVRRVTPRLPEAAGPCSGMVVQSGGSPPLRLLVIGESPVAGVGVATHEQAITGQLALALSRDTGRSVQWQACGRNGVTVGEALTMLVPALSDLPVDIAVIAFGVNDTTAFHRPDRWQGDLTTMWQTVRQRCQPCLTILCGVPPVGRFPALPLPLRWVLGLKADTLDQVVRKLARRLPDTLHVPTLLEPSHNGLMAEDGYHPSAAGCSRWAAVLAEACAAHIAMPGT